MVHDLGEKKIDGLGHHILDKDGVLDCVSDIVYIDLGVVRLHRHHCNGGSVCPVAYCLGRRCTISDPLLAITFVICRLRPASVAQRDRLGTNSRGKWKAVSMRTYIVVVKSFQTVTIC